MKTHRVKTISEYHQLRSLPKAEHPLISVIDYTKIVRPQNISEVNWVFEFYIICLKRGFGAKIKYGQSTYDFDEGTMFFIAPNQVFRIEPDTESTEQKSGWMLLIHPDFLWNSPLANKIKQYEYFEYSADEALFLSEKEELKVKDIIENIRQEYSANIDAFSQSIIVSQIETLLNYSERFYQRQFITRKKENHRILEQVEKLLAEYFNSENLIDKGVPTVQYIADSLNISPRYLSSLMKVSTGLNTQQFIHEKLIEKAKEMLSVTQLSISEIAYDLGFEHPQSFSKFFKAKTQLTPLAFRQSFN